MSRIDNNENNVCVENTRSASKTIARKPLALWIGALAAASVLTPAHSAFAQEMQAEEEIVVTGTRQIIQDQISIKRNAVNIVDGLSASDIGELPALSIGEALESITGAASHRENGGATEISIRGMGPFLSATTFNGREATNGSGDRSVNFSMFPSEMMNKIAIQKTQSADMIEGGVAGVIALETLKPLDYGKRRIQADLKGSYNSDSANVDNSLAPDVGYRGTVSYVDSFDLWDDAAIGFALGYQSSVIGQPEAEYRSSSPSGSSLWACLNDPDNTNEGLYRSTSGDCEDQVSGSSNQGYNTEIDPATGLAISDGSDHIWLGSSRSFRQNETLDDREAFFAAVQFQPNDMFDMSLDVEISERNQEEQRHDLIFNQKRVVAGEFPLVVTDGAIPLAWRGEDRINAGSESFSRVETYEGGGFQMTVTPTDRLTLDFDLGYSKTTREELQVTIQNRIGSTGSDGSRQEFAWNYPGDSQVAQFTLYDFDVTDGANFGYDLRARADRENARENDITSFRFDAEYELDMPFVSSIEGGVRSSAMNYVQFADPGSANTYARYTFGSFTDVDFVTNSGCDEEFRESSFLSAVSDGNLFTNVDADGSVIDSGTGNTYYTYDIDCLANAIAVESPTTDANGETVGTNGIEYPELSKISTAATDVSEDTLAAYFLANYETELFDRSLRGNLGVRVVNTEVESIGYRAPLSFSVSDAGVYSLVQDDDAALERVVGGGDYTEVLPSASFVFDLTDDVVLRGGVFRGLSRVDPKALSYSRQFDTDDEAEAPSSPEELLLGASGSGNPNALPYASWNTDISAEWYPNDDTILAVGVYHKRFTGGPEEQIVNEDFFIDGEAVTLPITVTETTDDSSDLYGIEMTASYRFDFGMGLKASYNHAETSFETEDSLYGDIFDVNGNQTNVGIVEPGSIPGFSEDVFSGQVYYQIGGFDAALIYKYRSEYFQPYTSNSTRLRYIGDVGVWETKLSYRLNSHVKFKLEVINLFSEPKTQYFFEDGNLGEVNDYGTRLFAGVTVKF